MPKFAVIKTGGKQYTVTAGQKVKIEKLAAKEGDTVSFGALLVADGDSVSIGTPEVAGAKVEGKVVRQFRDEKKIVFRFHSKTRYRKKKGHRQPLTEIQITSV